MSVIIERLKEVEGKHLIKGSGDDVDHACIMQLVSYVAGEPWTDRPACTCPVLTHYGISLNDRLGDDDRQKLAPLISVLVGTRKGRNTEIARGMFFAWRTVTVVLPILTDLVDLPEISAKLRAFAHTKDAMREAKTYIDSKRAEIRGAARKLSYAAAAAYAAAYAAAAAADAAAYAAADAADAAAYAAADAAAYAADAADAAVSRAKVLGAKARLVDAAVETLRLACEIEEPTP